MAIAAFQFQKGDIIAGVIILAITAVVYFAICALLYFGRKETTNGERAPTLERENPTVLSILRAVASEPDGCLWTYRSGNVFRYRIGRGDSGVRSAEIELALEDYSALQETLERDEKSGNIVYVDGTRHVKGTPRAQICLFEFTQTYRNALNKEKSNE